MSEVEQREGGVAVVGMNRPGSCTRFRAKRNCDVPIIGATNGCALGGGFSLALACDLRIAAADAVFQWGQMLRGIVPEYGLSYFLQQQLGAQARST